MRWPRLQEARTFFLTFSEPPMMWRRHLNAERSNTGNSGGLFVGENMPIVKRADDVKMVLLVVVLVTVFVAGRNCIPQEVEGSEDLDCTSAPTSPSTTVSAVPSASAASPPGVFSPVEALPEHAVYSNGRDCVVVTSRSYAQSKGEAWGIPYPFRIKAGSSDCGTFPALQMGGWRTAYCLKDNERIPTKLYLLQSPQRVFELQVGQESFHGLSAASLCP